MADHLERLERVRQTILIGDAVRSAREVQEALDEGLAPLEVLDEGLLKGAHEVGKGFESGVLFLPELMLAGRALKSAMAILTPAIQASHRAGAEGSGRTGRVVLATIQTDIHDIGKNIVSSMLTASGLEVIDLGVDVPGKTIIARAIDTGAQLIAVSALLTTSLPYLRDLLDLLRDMGLRQRFRVIVGGAAVTQQFVDKIGADGTAPNAVRAAELARRLLGLHVDQEDAK